MKMKLLMLIFFLITLSSCLQNSNSTIGVASSASYKPINPGEDEALKKADKSILPQDIKNSTQTYDNISVVWTGIVEKMNIYKTKNDETVVDIYLQHRYYDFIEDFSIQQEKMFVSPFGEGEFILRKKIDKKIPIEELKRELPNAVFKECFLITYGRIGKTDNEIPLLEYENMRIVFPENYATNIFSYKFERDKNKNIVLDENGQPKQTDFKMLKVASQGRNQFGSRLENSVK
jgi:hypothetical protein